MAPTSRGGRLRARGGGRNWMAGGRRRWRRVSTLAVSRWQAAAAGSSGSREAVPAGGSRLQSPLSDLGLSRCAEEIEGLRVYSAASIKVEALGRISDTASSVCLRPASCAG
ncbi:unnamed protein product [Linum trigynum]|uniref:Uncharacterized protein n=1 Tax=Linum trigynum TaxID=586398 RepID=A0AAV2GWK2_9ROSI